jgi:hypothetical protein
VGNILWVASAFFLSPFLNHLIAIICVYSELGDLQTEL